jgi:autotransporter-associated beta strand protein
MKPRRNLFLGSLLVLALSQTAHAVDYYWNTTTTGSWGTGANWSNNATSGGTTGVVPLAADSVFFNQSSINGAETITLDADRSITGITFANTGTTAINGNASGTTARKITLGNGGITINSGAGNVTFGQAAGILTLETLATTQVWTNNATLLTAGPVTGNGQLTLTGANSSSVNNVGQFALDLSTYTGNLILNNSRLVNTVATNGFGTTGTITVNNGAQLGINVAGTTISRAVSIAGNGWYDTGAVQRGAIRFLTTGTFSNTVTLAANSRIVAGAAGEFSGRVTGGFNLEIGRAGGEGGTITFSGSTANDYSGLTTISSGTLSLNKTAGTNAIAGNVLVTSGGTLSNTADNQIANTATISVDNTSAVWALNTKSETIDTLNLSGPYTAGKGFTTGIAGKLTVTNLNVSGGGVTLNSAGVGNNSTITANTVTNTGGTWVFGTQTGTQSLVVGSGGLTIGGGSTIAVASSATATTFISLGGNVTSSANANSNTISTSGTNLGELRLNATRTFDVADGAAASDLTISAILANGTGTGAIVKTGAGLLTLSGINTYSGGTQIDTGTLTLGHATNTLADAGSINVNGGSLALGTNTETVGAVTLTSGSITGSGTAVQGVLTGSSYDVRSGSVSAKLAGASVNMVKSTSGTVTLSGANTFTGSLTIKEGTVLSTNSTAITTASSLILGDSTGVSTTAATFDITTANVTYNNAINVVGTNQVNTIRDTSFTLALGGPITLTNANLTLNQATTAVMNVTGGVTGTGATQNLIISSSGPGGSLNLTTAAINNTGTVTNNGSGASATNISSVIGTNVTGVIQNSATSILTLSGPNTYAGTTTLTTGRIRIGVDSVGSVGSITSSALGTGGLTFNGGTLSSDSVTARTILNAVTFTGNVTLGDATNNGKLTFGAGMNLGGATRTITLSSDVQLDGAFSNPGGTSAITKAGAGTLTINASNAGVNFGSGGPPTGFVISAGKVIATNTAAFGNAGQIVTLNGGTVEFATDTSPNAYVIGQNSNFAGTVILNRATSGTAISYSMGVAALGGGTNILNVQKGGNVTDTPTLALAGLTLTGGSGGSTTLNPTTANISIAGTVTASGTASAKTLQLDGTSTGNLISGSISNGTATPLSLTKANTGTWSLNNANSYTGATAVTGGILAIGHKDALSGTSGISVATGGATLRIDVPDATSTTIGTGKSVSIAGNGASNFGALVGAASTNVTWAGGVVLAANVISRISGGDSGTMTVSGVISGLDANAGVLVSRAPNSTTIFSNVNTYTGDTQFFMSGSTTTLKMGIANAINSGSRVLIGSTTTGTGYFDLNGFNQNVRAISDTVGGDLVVTNSSSSADAELKLSTTDAQTFGGWIQDGATRKTSLVISGTGSQNFTNINTHTGGTRIDSGTLTLGNATNTLANTGAVNVNGGTLALGTNTDTVGAVTLTSGNITGSGTASQGVLTGSSYDMRNGSVSAKLAGTGAALTKTTAGTVTLSAANTYTGATTINGGTLALGVDGSIDGTSGVALGGGTFDVSAKGVGGYTVNNLTGTGSVVGGLTVSTTLAIGNSPGEVSFDGDLTLGTTSIAANFDYEFTGGATAADLGIVSGDLTLDSKAFLNLFQLGTYTLGDTFTLFAYEGTLSGTFIGLAEGDTLFDDESNLWKINYAATAPGQNYAVTGQNYVNITAIPEPNVAALLGALGTLILLRRRRA